MWKDNNIIKYYITTQTEHRYRPGTYLYCVLGLVGPEHYWACVRDSEQDDDDSLALVFAIRVLRLGKAGDENASEVRVVIVSEQVNCRILAQHNFGISIFWCIWEEILNLEIWITQSRGSEWYLWVTTWNMTAIMEFTPPRLVWKKKNG